MFSKEERSQVKRLLVESFQAASDFDGSEQSEQKLFEPLYLFDDFVRAHDDDSIGSEREEKISKVAFPDHPISMPLTVDGFLDVAAEFYERLKNTYTQQNTPEVWDMLETAGAVLKQSDQVFVKTDVGNIQEGQSDNPNSYQVKTEPRLAVLIAHLRNDGQWWNDISAFLSGNAEPTAKKVNVQTWNNKRPKLDMDLAKQSLFAHWEETGEWLSGHKKGADGKSYVLEHGPYAENLTASALGANLYQGQRGLPSGSSIAKINNELKSEMEKSILVGVNINEEEIEDYPSL